MPGGCSVRVWAYPGLNAVFRISGGEGGSAGCRRYEHTFQHHGPTDSHGRVCFEARNVCKLNDAWGRGADEATFGFELLEFHLPSAPGAAPEGYVRTLRNATGR